jgi:iron complex outermembrane receptor protein
MLSTASIGCLYLALGQAQAADKPNQIDAARQAEQANQSAETDQVPEIIVTAQRRNENIQSIPTSIQALNGSDISKMGITSSAEIAQFVPNVDLTLPQGVGNQAQFTIRGIGLNDFNSNNAGPNGVYSDEVYLSSPASQSFQTLDLERIEVLKGPQGTLYGRNASGGAINYISRKPTEYLTGHASASYASYGRFNFEAAIGGPIASNLTGRIAVTTNQGGNYFTNLTNGKKINGVNNIAGRAILMWKPTADFTVTLTLRGGRVDNLSAAFRHLGTKDPVTGAQCDVSRIFAGGCIDRYGFGTPADFYSGESNRTEHLKVNDYGGSLRLEQVAGAFTVTSLTGFIHNDRFHPEDSDANSARLLEVDYTAVSDTFSQEVRGAYTDDRWNGVVGVYYSHENIRQAQPMYLFRDADLYRGGPGTGDGVAMNSYTDNFQQTEAAALFGQVDYKITKQFSLTVGARASTETKRFTHTQAYEVQQGGMDNFGPLTVLPILLAKVRNNSFNYRVALDYKPAERVLLYASIATGFKSGGFNGGFLSTDPIEMAQQLQPARPEQVRSYEVGFKSSWFNRRVLFNVAAFYNDYRDMQVFLAIPSSAAAGLEVEVLDNAPKAHTQGIDLEMIIKPFRGLTITENFGLLKARLDQYAVSLIPGGPNYSGNDLPLAPRASSSTIIHYEHDVAGGVISAQYSASYKSRRYFSIANTPISSQNGYWLQNARIAYQHTATGIEVGAFVRNLANQKYIVGASDISSFGLVEYVVGEPRSVGVDLRFNF